MVPPNQSEMMAEAVRKKGLKVKYVTFEGEQHGFRKAENIIRSLEEELAFYRDVFGYGHRTCHHLRRSMIVKRFFEPLIAQNSYLIGCAAAGEAIVIDPNRDVQQYIDAAAGGEPADHPRHRNPHPRGLPVGIRELAHRTGARLCLSDEGDADWKYQFDHDRKLEHGDRITIGNVAIDVLHTPGHTPEHLTFLITDGAVADQPIAAVTGDFVFVGDVGRPDLLEKAAKIAGTMESGRADVVDEPAAVRSSIPTGCRSGRATARGRRAARASAPSRTARSATSGSFNWAFTAKTEDDFVANVLSGQPDPPPYFAMMKRINKEGPPLAISDRAADHPRRSTR